MKRRRKPGPQPENSLEHERRKPGPHPEKPLEYELKARADKDTMEKLAFCQKLLKTSRSDIIRRGVHCLYKMLASESA